MSRLDEALYRSGRVCPWWLCFTFDNPLRRMLQNPDAILKGLLKPGQTALDIGCGMGYFSLAPARLAGPGGMVVCVDLQARMLEAARQRAHKAGLDGIMKFQQCTPDSLGLTIPADFALTFWMVHEVGDQRRFLGEIKSALKPGGTLLIAEPKLHVSRAAFDRTLAIARDEGFIAVANPSISWSMAVLLRRP